MGEIDESGLKERGGVGKPKRLRREKNFFSEGSDFTMSLDGHDNLCGFQKSTFPLCVYGGQDTFSGRIQFLRISTTNNDPMVIGRYYMDYLFETERLPLRLRVDRGTETGDLTTIHCYLLDKKLDDMDVTDCILYGPSTENKIERFWRELHHRLEIYFKRQLSSLLESGAYNPSNKIERQLLAYIYIPVIQKKLDTFKDCVWNNHRSRKNDRKEFPTGVPEHIYHFPEKYGGRNCGFHMSVNELEEVSELSGVYQQPTPYFTEDFKQKCLLHVDSNEINSSDADTAYKYLKEHFK
ncbi:hypothetical protein LOTGIDRAFT_175038 [Lottia gigantea]|uniref:Integrase core domain-containing protein n=1 Tax=Lottia gigantea TaxID=225164 RepID=V4AMF0_LOTGI|nr:hypothetical protein LOTGIDRAFT_175038 [Lottia gigantea]ESO95930.1 hypothetical protein LOTGIDRAFT_175038 [Lottia gigantea]